MKNRIYYYLIILIISLSLLLYYSYNRFRYRLISTLKDNTISFGQTINENNSNSINYSEGIILGFQSFNRTHPNKLNLILYNDQDEKDIAINNAKILINYFDVLGLIGIWGTTSTIGIYNNITKDRNIPLIGPYTGTPIIRRKYDKNLILLQGYALDEFKMMIKHMESNDINNLSFIYQNDDFGVSYFNSFTSYINNIYDSSNINIISKGTFERNSMNLYDCFKSLLNVNEPYDYNLYQYNNTLNNMEAVIVICSEMQVKDIINFLKKIKPELYIYLCSFTTSNSNTLKDINNKNNIYQTLLNYDIKKYPKLYKKFVDELNHYNSYSTNKIKSITQCTYQGFYTGLLVGEVIKNFNNLSEINRKNFIDEFYKIKNFNLDGLKIGPFTSISNNGIDYVSFNKLDKNGHMEFMFDNKHK